MTNTIEHAKTIGSVMCYHNHSDIDQVHYCNMHVVSTCTTLDYNIHVACTFRQIAMHVRASNMMHRISYREQTLKRIKINASKHA